MSLWFVVIAQIHTRCLRVLHLPLCGPLARGYTQHKVHLVHMQMCIETQQLMNIPPPLHLPPLHLPPLPPISGDVHLWLDDVLLWKHGVGTSAKLNIDQHIKSK
jgi:hypothetical protein